EASDTSPTYEEEVENTMDFSPASHEQEFRQVVPSHHRPPKREHLRDTQEERSSVARFQPIVVDRGQRGQARGHQGTEPFITTDDLVDVRPVRPDSRGQTESSTSKQGKRPVARFNNWEPNYVNRLDMMNNFLADKWATFTTADLSNMLKIDFI
ncbi:MAG: hypothetical protein ACKOZY_08875, partial [Flavobacteriales bacterium]